MGRVTKKDDFCFARLGKQRKRDGMHIDLFLGFTATSTSIPPVLNLFVFGVFIVFIFTSERWFFVTNPPSVLRLYTYYKARRWRRPLFWPAALWAGTRTR